MEVTKLYISKNINLKSLYIAWLQLDDTLEKEKLWRQ
jgi:hypothetical protein